VKEKALYEVMQFVEKQLGCNIVEKERGTNYGRIDVIGVREIEGDLSSNFEIIGVEVKQADDTFLKSAGQAKGYSVYVNRCYLAKEGRFVDEEMEIARVLGIGLIEVGGDIREVLSSPFHFPSPVWQRKILYRLGQVVCTICGTVFPYKDTTGGGRSTPDVIVRALQRAKKGGRPYHYYLYDYNERHKADQREYVHQKRFVCKDCLRALFSA
jgi:hypothetical protein